jgi:uncharacterized protein
LVFVTEFVLALTGFFAGLIDSIAGGGGLITFPVLSHYLELGPHTIGTNKVIGTIAASVAFLVYRRSHALSLKRGAGFLATIMLGAYLGSVASLLVPREFFRWLLVAMSPLILLLVWSRQLWLRSASGPAAAFSVATLVTGLANGFYEGFFGPGGGTFMLLSLLWVARLPFFEALLLSKLANMVSSGVSGASYAVGGYVHWSIGFNMAAGSVCGALVGSYFASKHAERIAKPILTVVVFLLVASMLR